MELPDLNELDDIIVTIEEDDGSETECQVICMFEYDEKAYAALTPTDENIAEAYIFSVTFEDQGEEMEFTLENIDDEELLAEVGEVFTSIMGQADEDEALPDGVSIDKPGISLNPQDSHNAVISDGDDDSYWDQFINKKLEDI